MHPGAHIIAIHLPANSFRRFACGVPPIGVRISTVRDFKEPGILYRVVRDYIGFHALDSERTGIRVWWDLSLSLLTCEFQTRRSGNGTPTCGD